MPWGMGLRRSICWICCEVAGMNLVGTCPRLDFDELTEKIRYEVVYNRFLFFRTAGGDELDWILGEGAPGYQMHCTACHETFFEPKKRGQAASSLHNCPRCGATITPRRWNDRKCLDEIQFAFHLFQRGEGEKVWFRSFQVRTSRNFEDGDPFDFFEYARILYMPGAARRWTRSRSWFCGTREWEERKSIALKRWNSSYGYTRDDFFGGVSMGDIAGSCLEYSQAQEAFDTLTDPIAYFGLYCRYPACEYLWKMGLGRFFRERETHGGAQFQRAVNLRAKKPAELLRGMSRQEMKLIAGRQELTLAEVLQYRKLRESGCCRADEQSLTFAQEAHMADCDIAFTAEQAGATPVELRRWYERQAKRSGNSLHLVMLDHADYLRQLERLSVQGGDTLPHDLQAAHERLSARERKLKNAARNGQFRIRRKLLRWLCWRHGGLFIRPVDSIEEITREGEQQHNCVAGYGQRHAAGKTIILVLRRAAEPGKSWHTVELDPHTRTVIQCRGYRNDDQTDEAAAFIKAWLDHLNEIRPIEQRRRKAA